MEWVIFSLVLVLAIIIDFVALSQSKKLSWKQGLFWTFFWIAVSLFFNLYVACSLGSLAALQFFTGYLLEKALSIDNLFVFIAIFSVFQMAEKDQPKILFYGILGACILRFAFIMAGIQLIDHFEWVQTLFGFFLVVTALYFLRAEEDSGGQKKWLDLLKKMQWNKKALALLAVAVADVLFALDSIPAIFGITKDPFLVYSSNVFAVLGMRALHTVIAPIYERLSPFRFGVSLILVFVGGKMIIEPWFSVPIVFSLGVIVTILGCCWGCSVCKK